uniref:Uncharacterized protein n=1 Tax=Helianthus annuus TaxID=4232 RepID=A0A251SQ49_HELAN
MRLSSNSRIPLVFSSLPESSSVYSPTIAPNCAMEIEYQVPPHRNATPLLSKGSHLELKVKVLLNSIVHSCTDRSRVVRATLSGPVTRLLNRSSCWFTMAKRSVHACLGYSSGLV